LTYDNNFDDPQEVLTRHTKTKRRTHVAMMMIDDDLELALGEMDAAEAARQVMSRIGANVSNVLYCTVLYCTIQCSTTPSTHARK
jgi:hypothetical protein